MAISKNSTIDFAKIATEMRAISERWYNAEIEIVDPETNDQVWDVKTNKYTGDVETVLWSGKARIQQIRGASEYVAGVGQVSTRPVRFQVPYDEELPLIRKGLQIRVTDGGEEKVLETLSFVVEGTINSSYGWNRTIECYVDLTSANFVPDNGGGS
jgi:hypothetical protein